MQKVSFKKLDQRGVHHLIIPAIAFIVLFASIGAYLVFFSEAASSNSPELRSGINISGGPYCLDDKGDQPNVIVDDWPCNNTAAQHFSYDTSNSELMLGVGCVVVQGANVPSNHGYGTAPVYISTTCTPTPYGAAWTRDGNFLLNNHADSNPAVRGDRYCLDIRGGSVAKQPVEIYPCTYGANEQWFPDTYGSSTGGGGSTGGGTTGGPGTGSGGGGVNSSEVATICKRFAMASTACNNVDIAATQVAGSYGSWNTPTQLYCLGEIWELESGWDSTIWEGGGHTATQPPPPYVARAYGIPQSLPYSKMPKAAWPTGYGGSHDPATQIAWGLSYMTKYGNPCNAYAFDLANKGY